MSDTEIVFVKDVMSKDVVIVSGLTTVAEGVKLAKRHEVKMIIIDKRDEFDEYGIVLMSDIAKKVLAENRSAERVNMYEVMSKPALAVSPDMDVRYCARLFENFGIGRAPVIKDGVILGSVSYNTIVLNGMI